MGYGVEAVELEEDLKVVREAEELRKKLEKDHDKAIKLKKENEELRKKIGGLVENNQKLVGLVKELDGRMKETRILPKDKLIYSYQQGGMIKPEDIGRKHIELKRKQLDLQEINAQLSEILAILEKRKK